MRIFWCYNVHVKQVQVNCTISLNKRIKDTALYPTTEKTYLKLGKFVKIVSDLREKSKS